MKYNDFILKPYSQILSAKINSRYVDLVALIGLIGKSQTYDLYGTKE